MLIYLPMWTTLDTPGPFLGRATTTARGACDQLLSAAPESVRGEIRTLLADVLEQRAIYEPFGNVGERVTARTHAFSFVILRLPLEGA